MNPKNVWSLQRPHQTHSHYLHFKITGLAKRFFPQTVFKQDTLLLYKECRGKEGGKKKACPFFFLENSRPLSPWGPPDFLSTCLGNDSLIRSWPQTHGDSEHLEEEHTSTASFLVTCRQAEGGNRMLEVRDPLFHWSMKHQGPGRTLETRTPGAQVRAPRSTGSPVHILTLNWPFTFSQPLHMTSACQHQKMVWQIMKN